MLRSALQLVWLDGPAGAPVNHLFCRGARIPLALLDAKRGPREIHPERAGPARRTENQSLASRAARGISSLSAHWSCPRNCASKGGTQQ
ncbi:hypothetical protein GJAV_G00138070 [Gymnothorax javanicus]|nr:hypothetical protein GJAV_G00138070 [Gymnothorax javanicus]